MTTLKEQAFQLRKKGKSYKAIVREIGVPKTTLAGWLHGYKWSEKIKMKLTHIQNKNASLRMVAMADRMREQRQRVYEKYRKKARSKFKTYFKESLFVAGLMLYWGEGDSNITNGQIRISNSDPMILRFFHKFIHRYFPAIYSKIKMSLVLYPDLKDMPSRKYWSEKVGIPLDRFMKSQYIRGRSLKRTLPYGTAQIYICHKAYKHQLLELIEQARQYIQHAGIV